MKTALLLLSLLLLVVLLLPAGRSVPHPHRPPQADTLQWHPLRVVRSRAAARQHHLVRAVNRVKSY